MKILTKQEEIIVKLCHPELMNLAQALERNLKNNEFPHGLVLIDFPIYDHGESKDHMEWETPLGHVGFVRCRRDPVENFICVYVWANPTTEYGWEFGELATNEFKRWIEEDYPFITTEPAPLRWKRKR